MHTHRDRLVTPATLHDKGTQKNGHWQKFVGAYGRPLIRRPTPSHWTSQDNRCCSEHLRPDRFSPLRVLHCCDLHGSWDVCSSLRCQFSLHFTDFSSRKHFCLQFPVWLFVSSVCVGSCLYTARPHTGAQYAALGGCPCRPYLNPLLISISLEIHLFAKTCHIPHVLFD